MVFWKGALVGKKEIAPGWSLSTISSYYIILTVAASLLMCHIEENVAEQDIKEGHLVKYLTKPFSYYWMKFFEEIPYRMLQGSYGIILCVGIIFFYGNIFVYTKDPGVFLLALVISVLALFICFTYKMILGLIALWVIDVGGIFQLENMIATMFAGFILPLELFPHQLYVLANILPHPYMIYYPIIAFEGKLSYIGLFQVIGAQLIWLSLLTLLYSFTLSKGIKKFSGVGN